MRERVSIQIPDDLIDWLDELAAESRLSRSRVIELILLEARDIGWRAGIKQPNA